MQLVISSLGCQFGLEYMPQDISNIEHELVILPFPRVKPFAGFLVEKSPYRYHQAGTYDGSKINKTVKTPGSHVLQATSACYPSS